MTWTLGMGASGFPGQVGNNGDVTISSTVTFADSPPAFPISSLTIGGTASVQLGMGTLTVTGNFNLGAGTTLTIPAGATLVVNGSSVIAGTLSLPSATSKVIFNGPITQSGSGSITAVMGATVQLGTGVTSLPGAVFQSPFLGIIQTGSALTLTSSLTMGMSGVLNLAATMTVASGVTLTINNNAPTAITGGGNLQGAAANAIVNMTGGPTALQGTWFANPFNGTLLTSTAMASTLTGTLTIGSTGVLNLGNQLNPFAGANIILNNTAANSLTGGGTGKINLIAGVTVTLGPGFNAGTLDFDRFVSPIAGTLNTGGNLTATGTAAPDVIEFGTGSIFNITGTLTIASGKRIYINNTTAGALPGTGRFAAADNTAGVRFVGAANGGAVPGSVFSNPWNGRLRIDGNLQIGQNVGMAGSTVFNAGPNAIFDLNANTLQINDSLALNCTQNEATVFPSGGLITALAGGPSTGGGPGGRVAIGPNTFVGFVPAARLGTGTNWNGGNLFIHGASALNANYTFNSGTFLFLQPNAVLQVASNRTLTLSGRILGTGRINGQDNTATVTLTATFLDPAGIHRLPGANFGTPNFDGQLNITGVTSPFQLSGSLRMGPNAIYNRATVQTVVNTPDTLFFNQTAVNGLDAGTGTFTGTGTLFFGNNALGGVFPDAAVPSGTGPMNFSGRIILGDNVNFANNYLLNSTTVLQLNGTSRVNASVTLTINNMAANSLTGSGRLSAQAPTSQVVFNSSANNSIVPGNNFVSPYIGQITTNGPMTLTGSLNMGGTSVLALGGNLTIAPTASLTLGMNAVPTTALPGSFFLVGQPSGGNSPEIVLASGALGGQVPIPSRIQTGSMMSEFGGRLTIGTGYAITANTAINQPAILNIQTGAQLLVNAGVTLSLNTTNSPATGPGTGTIQGQNNTSVISFGNGFNGGTLPGAILASPFVGQVIIPSGGLSLSGSPTMGPSSILLLNGNLNVNAGSSLTLAGGVNSVQGTGLLNGANNTACIVLAAGFNGGQIPASRFANPFNGCLQTQGAMTLSGTMVFGAPSSLSIGGNLTIPANTALLLAMSGANTISGTGIFTAAAASSTVTLGINANGSSIPSANFANYNGVLNMSSSMNLNGSLTLGPTGILDIGGGGNKLTLGTANLSVVNPIRNTSATAYVITNSTGGLTLNNPSATSFFYPIGRSADSYTPLALVNAGASDVFTVRVRSGITNSPATFPNFVNVEWLITQAGTGARSIRVAPQWAAANQQGPNFNINAVGLGVFVNNNYVLTATGASISVGSGLVTAPNGAFTATFDNTPLVAYSRVVIPPPMIIQPVVTSINPTSLPVSNDPFTIQFFGVNLGNIRSVTARNLNSNAEVPGTITDISGSLLTVNFPGIVRGIAGTVQITLTNATMPGFTTANLTITPISSPTLTAVSPATTTASGRPFTVTLTGTNFLAQSVFTVNGAAARVMRATTATSVALEVPATLNNTANTITFTVRNTDGQTASITYTIGQAPRPFIENVAPRAVFAGTDGVTITIDGSGFFPGNFLTLFFGNTQLPVNVVSSTRLTVTVPASLLTRVGFPSIIITNSDGQSIGYVFSILERAPLGPTPVLRSFTPSTTTATGRAFTVVLTGSNFSLNALVSVRGNIVTPISRDTNRYVVEVPSNLNTPEPLDIVIQNPDLQFVTARINVGQPLPAPVISSITPMTTRATTEGRAFTLTVSGTNFTTNATVLLNGRPLQIVSQTATTIVAIVPSNRPPVVNFIPAENTVVVLNSDGQATAAAILLVSAPVAVLESTLPGFSVYPSPVHDIITVQGGFERPSNVVVSVSNILGQRVLILSDQQVSGAYSRQINLAGLPSGSYILEVSDGARRFVQKIMKY
ncbi:MAG: T9SS type A sorting domain-containing protein [Bacteroidota bacterium]|nr:T9SS type A sorting domain-containing protein [Candidatus Kapabacteria bacterium]MDW8219460.1 T9SS type A sorting domain-containing protein [Bacteroidota bacterium]